MRISLIEILCFENPLFKLEGGFYLFELDCISKFMIRTDLFVALEIIGLLPFKAYHKDFKILYHTI